MLDSQTTELINKAIDDQLESGEEATLATLLSRDSEARTLYEQLSAMTSLIEAQPPETAPRDISEAVRARLISPGSEIVAIGAALNRKSTKNRRTIRAFVALAASMMIAVGIVTISPITDDDAALVGTLARPTAADQAPVLNELIYLVNNGRWAIEIDIKRSVPFELTLRSEDQMGSHNPIFSNIDTEDLQITQLASGVKLSGQGPVNTTLFITDDNFPSIRPELTGSLSLGNRTLNGRITVTGN